MQNSLLIFLIMDDDVDLYGEDRLDVIPSQVI